MQDSGRGWDEGEGGTERRGRGRHLREEAQRGRDLRTRTWRARMEADRANSGERVFSLFVCLAGCLAG